MRYDLRRALYPADPHNPQTSTVVGQAATLAEAAAQAAASPFRVFIFDLDRWAAVVPVRPSGDPAVLRECPTGCGRACRSWEADALGPIIIDACEECAPEVAAAASLTRPRPR